MAIWEIDGRNSIQFECFGFMCYSIILFNKIDNIVIRVMDTSIFKEELQLSSSQVQLWSLLQLSESQVQTIELSYP